jgi:hypothetical protein
VDQYLEVVPGVGGDYRADDAEDRGGRAGAPDPTRLLGAATTAQLARMGPDGRRVAAVAALGAPRGRLVARGGAPRAERRSRMSIADRATGGAIGSATSALTGSGGGLGIGFPLLLAGGAAFAAARRFVRRS